jgi:hypothetical protein
MARPIDGQAEIQLDMPLVWLRLTGRIRGYGRRELAVLVAAVALGFVSGRVAGR